MNNLRLFIESVAEGMSQFAELSYRHIDAEDVPALLDEVGDYPNYERGNVDKYLKWGGDDLEYVGLFSGKRLAALAVLKTDDGFTVVEQINSFSKGSGARLLKDIIANRGNVVLMANPDADERLAGWYRSPEFGLEEVTIEKSTYGKPLHFFKTPDCVLSADNFIARFKKKDDVDESSGDVVKTYTDLINCNLPRHELVRLLDSLESMRGKPDVVNQTELERLVTMYRRAIAVSDVRSGRTPVRPK